MAGKKKSQKDTVQATLGNLVETEKKPTKKTSKKSTVKTDKKKSSKKATKSKPKKKTTSTKKPAKKPAKKDTKPKPKKKTTSKKKPTKKPAKKPPKTPAPEEAVADPGPPLKVLPGVGQKLEEKLKAAKYDTVEKISRARSKSIAKKVDGLSLAGAKKLITAAKELVKGGATPTPAEKPPVSEADEAVEPPAATIKLTDLPGVGAKLAKELERSGYNTVARLSRSRPSSVAKVVDGLSLKKATTLVDAAIELIREAEMIAISETIAPKAEPPKKAEPEEEPPKEKAAIEKVPEPKTETPPKKAPKKTV
ncbi:MAG: helix-hairpin-helix domain-containing protein, partial [Candidatus Thorarchaeota archaeon]